MNTQRAMPIAAAAVACLVTANLAVAQPGPGMMMGPGMMGRGAYGAFCNPRMAGLAEWRIERIERAIQLADAQRTKLNELKTASAQAADQIAAACPAAFPTNSSERLAVMEKRMEAMLQAVKTVRPAYDAFYGSLNSEQKARLDRAGPRRWGWQRWRR